MRLPINPPDITGKTLLIYYEKYVCVMLVDQVKRNKIVYIFIAEFKILNFSFKEQKGPLLKDLEIA